MYLVYSLKQLSNTTQTCTMILFIASKFTHSLNMFMDGWELYFTFTQTNVHQTFFKHRNEGGCALITQDETTVQDKLCLIWCLCEPSWMDEKVSLHFNRNHFTIYIYSNTAMMTHAFMTQHEIFIRHKTQSQMYQLLKWPLTLHGWMRKFNFTFAYKVSQKTYIPTHQWGDMHLLISIKHLTWKKEKQIR